MLGLRQKIALGAAASMGILTVCGLTVLLWASPRRSTVERRTPGKDGDRIKRQRFAIPSCEDG